MTTPFRHRLTCSLLLALAVAASSFSIPSLRAQERQLTHAPHSHSLANINVWSPDGNWVLYDTRPYDPTFAGTTIEQVNAATGQVQILYESKNGAACGIATYHPREPKVIFILGPERPGPDWTYHMTRRRAVIVDTRRPGEFRPLDAMNYAPPFTPGALRGGSHVHVFSPDGAWVSNTYEDEVLDQLGRDSAKTPHDLNQRNVVVSVPAPFPDGVKVARTHPRNNDGDYFSVVVTRTVNQPRPGSDEISRAYEDGWVVGRDGRRSIAFIGNVTAPGGAVIPEVFLVELPADLTQQGAGLLEGTATLRPAPPAGVSQRRLTFTTARKYPGVVTLPRHWLRASPDGSLIAFLLKDDDGLEQLFTISPDGSGFRQITHSSSPVASAFTWSPDGRMIAYVMAGEVCITEVASGRTLGLTGTASGRPGLPTPWDFAKYHRTLALTGAAGSTALPQACVFSPTGTQIAFLRNVVTGGASYAQVFAVAVPSHPFEIQPAAP